MQHSQDAQDEYNNQQAKSSDNEQQNDNQNKNFINENDQLKNNQPFDENLYDDDSNSFNNNDNRNQNEQLLIIETTAKLSANNKIAKVAPYQEKLEDTERAFQTNEIDDKELKQTIEEAQTKLNNQQFKQALNVFIKAEEIIKKKYKNCKSITIKNFYQSYGHLQSSLSQTSKELTYFQKALEIQKVLHQNNNNRELIELYNLIGIAHLKSNSMFSKKNAMASFQQALQICNQENLENDIVLAQCYNNIGAVYGERNDFDNEKRFCNLALDIIKKLGDDEQLAAIENNLGLACQRSALYDEEQERKKKLKGKQLAEKHTMKVKKQNIIDLEAEDEKQMEVEKKKRKKQQKKKIEFSDDEEEEDKERKPKKRDPSERFKVEEYTDVIEYTLPPEPFEERPDEAHTHFLEAVKLQEKVKKLPNDPVLADYYQNLASAYHRRGIYEEEFKYLYKAFDIKKQLYGFYHYEVGLAYESLAISYTEQKKYYFARAKFYSAAKIYCRVIGKECADSKRCIKQAEEQTKIMQLLKRNYNFNKATFEFQMVKSKFKEDDEDKQKYQPDQDYFY